MSNIKIVLCGNNEVGKRSLIYRWAKGSFSTDEYLGHTYSKKIQIGNNVYTVELWSLDAEDIYNSNVTFNRSFFTNINGIHFVYDCSEQKSLSAMGFWMEQIAKKIGAASNQAAAPIWFLVGNKSDDSKNSDDINQARQKPARKLFTNDLRLRAFHIVSAKTGENVDACFRHLVLTCLVARVDPGKLNYLAPDFMLKALEKIGSKVRLKYESRNFSPFDSVLDGLESNTTNSKVLFIRSRMADELPSLLDSTKFLSLLKLAIKTLTFPVAKVALKCFQKLLAFGYLENNVKSAENWIDTLALSHSFMDNAQYQSLVAQTLLTLATSLRGCSVDGLGKAFGICFHLHAISKDQSSSPIDSSVITKFVRSVMLNQDVGFSTIRRHHRKSIYADSLTPEKNRGLEMVLAYLDESVNDYPQTIIKAVPDLQQQSNRQSKAPDAHVFEAACWLSTGYNRFVRVKGLAPYRAKSKQAFLDIVINILQISSNPTKLLHSSRQTFYMTLVASGLSTQADLFERLTKIVGLMIEAFCSGATGLIDDIGVLLSIFFYILENQSVPLDFKLHVYNSFTTLTKKSQFLYQVFVRFDCDRRRLNLFEKIATLLAQIVDFQSNLALPLRNRVEEASFRKENLKNITSLLSYLSKTAKQEINDQLVRFSEMRTRKALWLSGIEMFNSDPVKGIDFFQDKGLVAADSLEIAEMLRHDCRFHRFAIGELLGDNSVMSLQVLASFMATFDFSDCDFLPAVRKLFLHGFHLPGEAQKIDRIMDRFAIRYCECNSRQTIIANASAAHTLAYSVIMLNTDLHSPSIKQHMSKEQFIKNNRGINDSNDFPEDFLTKIYDDIAKEKLHVSITLEEVSRQSRPSLTNSKTAVNLISRNTNQQNAATYFEQQMEFIRLAANELLFSAAEHKTATTDDSFIRYIQNLPQPPVFTVQAMFELLWGNIHPVFRLILESPSPADDETLGLCIDCIYNAMSTSCDLNLTSIQQNCVELLSKCADRIGSVATVSESMLNMIASSGGREFVTFLRSSV